MTFPWNTNKRHPILSDPEATRAAIKGVSFNDPVSALMHPNCPPEIWWELALTLPIEAMVSPAYDLMTLESPERWLQMEGARKYEWMTDYLERLSFQDVSAFNAECLLRVLPVYQAAHPKDRTIPALIHAIGALHTKKMTDARYNKIHDRAKVISADIGREIDGFLDSEFFGADEYVEYGSRLYAAHNVVCGALAQHLVFAAQGRAQKAVGDAPAFFGRTKEDEERWQWERLCQIVRGDSDATVGAIKNNLSQVGALWFDLSVREHFKQAEQVAKNPNTPALVLQELLEACSFASTLGYQVWRDVKSEILFPLIRNPNCTPEMLERFVGEFPLEVSQNMALALIELERPGFVLGLARQAIEMNDGGRMAFFRGAGVRAAIGSMVAEYEVKTNPKTGNPWWTTRETPSRKLPNRLHIYATGLVVAFNGLYISLYASLDDMRGALAAPSEAVFLSYYDRT